MDFISKLDKLMSDRNINKNQLSKESGVPYTTIDGFYKKGTENIKLSTLKKLSSFFGCSLDYLADDEVQSITPPTPELSELESDLIGTVRKMNDEGQEKVLDYVHDLKASGKYKKAAHRASMDKSEIA